MNSSELKIQAIELNLEVTTQDSFIVSDYIFFINNSMGEKQNCNKQHYGFFLSWNQGRLHVYVFVSEPATSLMVANTDNAPLLESYRLFRYESYIHF